MEADFQQYYGVDLLDVYRGGLTLRKAWVLAHGLPAGARVWDGLGHPDAWTEESHKLADVVDLLNGANWQRAGSKGRAPKPMPRPEEIHAQRGREDRAAEKAERHARRMAAKRERQQQEQTG